MVAAQSERLLDAASRWGLSPQDSQDVVQNTWLSCLERLTALRQADVILPDWLLATCQREAMARREALHRMVLQDPHDESSELAAAVCEWAEPAEYVAQLDQAERLVAAIIDLPDAQRNVLIALLNQEDPRYRSVADRTGIPAGSLGPMRRRALARLRRDPRLVEAG
ncbi:MAG: hypothetical protein IPK24_06990 [Kineosporiaceae bacterium]|nr:hypothetical protein [Kineosporiaceae bacterium]MBK8075303.1 hypothetical protein [Kineosporiaceae bacterium]